ncbi:MAG: biotin--[acetyl-CoA-carboxylase] ligase [Planctomycetaceae bacterium]
MIIADPGVDPDGLLACQSLMESGLLARIRYYASIASTNSAALNELDEQAELALPSLYLADAQLAGRGRHGRTWLADRGTLTFSLVIPSLSPADMLAVPVSIAVGVAIARTIEHLAAPFSARLKWPNDVYLNGGKVAGILIETSSAKRQALVIGVGLNVATDFGAEPSLSNAATTSICALTQRYPHRYQWLGECVQQVMTAVDEAAQQPQRIVQEHRQRCLLSNLPIRYLVGDQWQYGVCQGIDDRGALQVMVDHTLRRLTSGEVQQCRLSARER